jgi:hypothetical protein
MNDGNEDITYAYILSKRIESNLSCSRMCFSLKMVTLSYMHINAKRRGKDEHGKEATKGKGFRKSDRY